MTIVAIKETSPYLRPVLSLARANRSTLGFLPPPAFMESAKEKRLLVANDKDGQLLGYLLYGISAKKSLAYITHLCVTTKNRGSGVATELVKELKSQTNAVVRGIRVRCRRDYQANNIWPSLGFSAVGEIPGRGKRETTLTVWWLDYGHPTLFDYPGHTEDTSRLKVSMDANVCFKLDEPESSDFEECRALLADWLDELIELCVTTELFNEIERQPEKQIRDKSRRWARRFALVTGSEDQFHTARVALSALFPRPHSKSDKSDIRQIARSIAAGIEFFVTLDPRLLELSDKIFQEFGIRVLRPADLILGQDSLVREAEYQPVRFAGVSMLVERPKPLEQPYLNHTFRAPQGERKQELARVLSSLLANPQINDVKVIKETDRPRALFVLSRPQTKEVEVPILRIDSALNKGMAATLARYLI